MSDADDHKRAVSTVLADLSARNGEGEDVHLGDVAGQLGSRAHGAAILILALPDTIPAPLPGLSGILGIPLFIVSLHLAVFGERGGLPARVAGLRVPGRMLSAIARYGNPVLRRVERLSHPRLTDLARRERLIGAVCALWSLILWLPIPFVNLPPATLLVLLSWGLVQRDGLFVLLGLLGSAAFGLVTLLLGEAALDLLRGLSGG